MPTKVKALLVEDSPHDELLVVGALEMSGYDVEYVRVETEAEFMRELPKGWDLVLSDFRLPTFSGPRALELLKLSGVQIPLIVVSGTIGEEAAVAMMRQGASDYFLKDRLGRLGAAVGSALDQEKLRRERAKAVEDLRLFRFWVEQSLDVFQVIDPKTGRFLDVNARGPASLGYTREEYLNRRVTDIDPLFTEEVWRGFVEKLHREKNTAGEGAHQRRDGTVFPVEFNTRWVDMDGGYIIASVRDITQRKEAETALRTSEARFRTTLENLMEGCQIISRDWRYLYVNEMAARHGHRTVDQLAGRRMTEVYPGIDHTPLFATLRECVESGKPREIENEFMYEAGGSNWFQLVIQPVPEGLFILSLDITARKRAEQEVARQLEELQRWHSLTIGREDRVIALKAEVNELLAQRGEPPRYGKEVG
jgi:PAS domain S-box-containing protein